MDVFSAEDYYKEYLEFNYAQPVNDKFKLIGVESLNFLVNSGSFYVIMAGLIFISQMKRIIHWMALKFSRVSIIRSIAIHFDTQDSKMMGGMTRLFLEGYFDMMFTLAMMFFILYRGGINEGTMIYFWDKNGDKLNGIIGGLSTLPLILFPVFVYRKLT